MKKILKRQLTNAVLGKTDPENKVEIYYTNPVTGETTLYSDMIKKAREGRND